MIVDFTVSNFRSIKEAQTLSFYAQHNTEHLADNIHYPAEAKIGVLASAGIYGANASGKSNFLLALEALKLLVVKSGDLKDGDPIPVYQPYLLSDENSTQPCKFELEFVLDGERYLYKVSFDAKKIHSEYLGFYPKGKSRSVIAKLFERKLEYSWKDITFGSLFTGGTKRHPLFDNNAYLSKAGNSADAPDQIRKIFNFFKIILFSRDSIEWLNLSLILKDENIVKRTVEILSRIDTGVSGFKIEPVDHFSLLSELPANMPLLSRIQKIKDRDRKLKLGHQNDKNELIFFELEEESKGTMSLGHFLPFLFATFERGLVFVWDEIESSLHPHIAELIIKLFNDPSVNINHAQLLFTTHNMALMNQNMMRKDQLWLTEKHQGATTISSLDEFDSSLKSNSPFAKWYDEGRLGGIPAINYGFVRELMTPKREGDEDAEV